MRYYEPAAVEAVLDRLLAEPSLSSGVVHHAHMPARPADFVPMPEWLDPGLAGRPGEPRRHGALSPPGRGHRGGPRRPGRGRGHPDGFGQVAVLPRADPPGPGRRSHGPGPLPLPHQGPRPGPGRRAGRAEPGRRPAHQRLHLRRRHSQPDPLRHPIGRPGRGHEPGHAPRRDPAAPHQVVPALRAAPDHRHRRAAHVPRPVRQPRRQRAAPAAPDLRPLRLSPGHRVLLGHDREPGRAGRRC